MSRLPKNARRVFHGIIFDVYQWKQKMYDGSFEIFEKIARPDTTLVIATVGKKILIQMQKQPDRKKSFISIPGGRVDKGEQPLESAKRELREETGYESKKWIKFSTERPSNKVIWTLHTFIARACAKTRAPHLDAGEKITLRLVTFDEFIRLADNPAFCEKGLIPTLLRARYNPAARARLRAKIFGG